MGKNYLNVTAWVFQWIYFGVEHLGNDYNAAARKQNTVSIAIIFQIVQEKVYKNWCVIVVVRY